MPDPKPATNIFPIEDYGEVCVRVENKRDGPRIEVRKGGELRYRGLFLDERYYWFVVKDAEGSFVLCYDDIEADPDRQAPEPPVVEDDDDDEDDGDHDDDDDWDWEHEPEDD